MSAIPVIAVFDVGKTNKKLFLFDEDYKIVFERTHKFQETVDEDGDACENLDELTKWGRNSFKQLNDLRDFDIRALNFSSYGASFVHTDENGKTILPLYNYLKPYPAKLKSTFFNDYGGEKLVSKLTASPVLDSLNSGLQLYRLKHEKKLTELKGYSLHLPQYLSYLITGKSYADITSIGCHTMLWNYEKNDYHEWVTKENINKRLAPIFPSDEVIRSRAHWKEFAVGVGLHDSSSALIPYLSSFHQPFILISTGTWCISLNPFNDQPLTDTELEKDCLSYLTYQRKPVKASRLFAGYEHEGQVKKLAAHFNKQVNYYETVEFDHEIITKLNKRVEQDKRKEFIPGASIFGERDLSVFNNYEEAYHQFMLDVIHQQIGSTSLVMKGTKVNRIFVDGGFSKNPVYMNLLALAFPEIEVYAASVAQATAMGAALAIHSHWNNQTLPADLIDLKYYADRKYSGF
jgi:sugar (pentulose or hexulose) kinase